MLPMFKNNLRRLRGVSALGFVFLLSGCSSLIMFSPAGVVGEHQRTLLIFVFLLMLFVLIPVMAALIFFLWRYRASNTKATYTPRWSESTLLEGFLWGGPIVILCIFAYASYYTTTGLDPYKAIASAKADPVKVEAIGSDWKWLFIYPQYNIASVNELAMPVNTPVSLHLTSDDVMMAFMIPQMGSQIYAMSGMATQLNMKSTRTGTFYGKNYQYNGDGFAKSNFHAVSMSEKDFKAWIKKAKASGQTLDTDRYAQLAVPKNMGVKYFSSVKPHLFRHVIGLYHTGKPRNRDTKIALAHKLARAHSDKPSHQEHAKTAER
jgi:cytochrome o ubiquinol oxidase subunit 2